MARKRKRSRSRSGGGISRRSLLLLLGAGTASATGAYTTGAFDAVSGDRSVDVGTASDDAALLGVDAESRSGVDGETVALVELTNRFDEPIESIDAEIVSASGGPVDPNSLQTPVGLSPGASGVVEADLSCETDIDGTVDVAITATGSDQTVDLTRSVDVSCTSQSRGVCAPRTPPGCTDEGFPPWGGTDCSVVIDTTGEISERIGGGIDIGGAVDIRTDSAVDITHRGTIADYFGIDTDGEIGFSMGGGATIGGVLQLSTRDEVTVDVSGSVGGGFCADEAGDLSVSVGRGGSIGGPMALSSSDEVTVEVNNDGSVGPLSVEAAGEVDVTVSGGSEIDGDVDVDTPDGADLTLSGNERIRGDVSITSEDEVGIDLSGSSTIEGDVTVTAEGEVEIELKGNSAIEGSVTLTSEDGVSVDIQGSSTVDGDVAIDTSDEGSVSDCTAVGGSVTPQSACDG